MIRRHAFGVQAQLATVILMVLGALTLVVPPANAGDEAERVVAETICGSLPIDYTMTANLVQETVIPTYHQDWPGSTIDVGPTGCQVRITRPSKRILEVGGTVNGDAWSVVPAPGSGIQSASLGTVWTPNCTAPAASGYVQANRPSCSADLVSNEGASTAKVTINVVPKPVLTVVLGGGGAGSVSSSPAGINCGTDCQQQYASGTKVNLVASATAGSVFDGWVGSTSALAGCDNATATCTDVTMNQNKQITAVFSPEGTSSVTVSVGGIGTGTISSNPAGVSCAAGDDTCSGSFLADQEVVLSAAPSSDSFFKGWGSPCSGTGTCTVTMTKNWTIVANFGLNPVPTDLTVSKNGTGQGVVTSDPVGIDCGATCTTSFDSGSLVDLTATPVAGSKFVGWSSGGCSGTAPCTVDLQSNTTVYATFALLAYQPDGTIAIGSGTSAGGDVYNNTGKGQTKSIKVARGKSKTFTWTVQNDGDGTDTMKLKQAANSLGGFQVQYSVGGTNVTKKLKAGKFTKQLAAGGAFRVKVKVSVQTSADVQSTKKVLLSATSQKDGTKKDAVGIHITATR